MSDNADLVLWAFAAYGFVAAWINGVRWLSRNLSPYVPEDRDDLDNLGVR